MGPKEMTAGVVAEVMTAAGAQARFWREMGRSRMLVIWELSKMRNQLAE